MNFISELIQTGGEVYLVGGAVRNMIYNSINNNKIKIKDKDLLVLKLTNDKIVNILKKYGSVKLVGASFGVLKFKQKGSNIEYDIALPRKEVSTGPGYRDFIIEVDPFISILEDFQRRDATINAIAMKINNYNDLLLENLDLNNIVDPFNGYQDVSDKKWRAIGDPLKRFTEDPIRILRAFRQCSELGFDIESKTLDCIKNNSSLLELINVNSRVRIIDELIRILKTNCFPILLQMQQVTLFDILNIPNENNLLFLKNLDSQVNMKIRLALLLNSHNNDLCFDWCIFNNVGSSMYYSKYWIKFIECIKNYYKKLVDVNSDYDMRILLQSLEYEYVNYGREFLIDLIDYYHIINNNFKFGNLLKKNINFLTSINDVKINGNQLINNFNISGIQIKNVKQHLLDKINKDELENNYEDILNYLNCNIKKIIC